MEEVLEKIAVVERRDKASFSDRVALLRLLRAQRVSRPDLVLKHGVALLCHSGSLGDELWALHEQVAMAALERHELVVAATSITALLERFGEQSSRVAKLVGMRREAAGQWGEAEASYAQALEAAPTNLVLLKRRAAALRAKGQLGEAIQQLNEIVEVFQGDEGAWQELAELHERLGHVDAAAFCVEELILLAPANHVYHCRLAELYSCARNARLVDARKHLAQSLKIAPRYPRALHCLVHVSYAIACEAAGKGRGVDLEVNRAMWEYGRDELLAVYADSPLRSAMAAMLARQEEVILRAQS